MSRDQSELTIVLVCTELPDLADPGGLSVGIQDKQQGVHSGKQERDGSWRFTCTVTVKERDGVALPQFSGPFVHGTPAARLLYLSWKRHSGMPAPWLQRVKIPLADIGWDMTRQGMQLVADITGRRPHAAQRILWEARRA